MKIAIQAALLAIGLFPGLIAAAETVPASIEAVIQGGASNQVDVAEADLGYLMVKYHAGLTSARKTYFQFDLSSFEPDGEKAGTLTLHFKNSYRQRVQLWGLNQAYPTFDSQITWNAAQANELQSNRLLTNGALTATAIGSSVVVPSTGTAPYTFTIPRLGDFIVNQKITLVLAGEEDTLENNAAGLRLITNGARLSFSVATNGWASNRFDVYLVGGQSNQDGRGYASDLTGTNSVYAAPHSGALIYYANPVNLDPNNPTYNTGWQTLAPGFSVPPGYAGALPSTRFGPEISFAHSLLSLAPGRKLALIKVTQGGTSLSGDWKPGTGYMYATLTNITRAALQELRDLGAQCTVRGMIWHQGESDTSGSAATNYETNLTQLILAIRRDLQISNLPFVIGEIATNKTELVRNAQASVAQNLPYVGFASADTLLTEDGTHFTSEGVLLLGKRFANAIEFPVLRLDAVFRSGATVSLTASGLAQEPVSILTSTNLATPRSEWLPLTNGTISSNGQQQFTLPGSGSQSFYLIQGK